MLGIIAATLGTISVLAGRLSNSVFAPLSRLNSRMMNERLYGGTIKDL